MASRDFIRPTDFQSIDLFFDIVNNTTGVPFHAGFQISLHELLEKGMILEVPSRSCSLGHALNIQVGVTNIPPEKDQAFEVTARVEKQVPADEGSDLIAITLVQFDEKAWEQFHWLFLKRQIEVTTFLAAARGLDSP